MSTDKTPQQELLQSQMNAGKPDNNDSSNEQLIEREQLIGTPFWAIKQNDKWALIMGKYKMNEGDLKSKEEVLDYIEENIYNIILRMTMILINDVYEERSKEDEYKAKWDKNEKKNHSSEATK